MKNWIVLAIALAPTLAGASTIIGNPNVGITLVAGDKPYIGKVYAHRCSGGKQVMSVEATLAGTELITFDSDTFCSVDMEVRWTPGGPLQTIAVGGFDTFKVVSSGVSVDIEVDANAQTADLL